MNGGSSLFPTTVYLLDTSGLIKLDVTFPNSNPVFSAIWEEMEDMIAKGELCIIDYVETEINKYEGKETFLQRWVKKHRKNLVKPTTADCVIAAIPIINSEYNTGFFDAKKQAAGEEEADPYLIAFAQVNNCTLITNESFHKPNKIPKVSEKFNVRCIDVYAFIQERGLMMVRKGDMPT